MSHGTRLNRGEIEREFNIADEATPELEETDYRKEPVVIDLAGQRYVITAVNGVGGEIVLTAGPEPKAVKISTLFDLMSTRRGARPVHVEVDGRRYAVTDMIADSGRVVITEETPVVLMTEEIQ